MTQVTQAAAVRQNRSVPRVPGIPLLGSAPDFARDLLGTFAKAFADHGDLVRFQVGNVALYLASHPDMAQHILVDGPKNFLKIEQEGKPAQGLGMLGGMGLLTNPNFELWRTQRRMMQPMFHRQRLAKMGDKMVGAGQRMLQRWESLERIDVDAEMLNVTMDIICRTMFSADVSSVAGQAAHASEVALHFVTKKLFSPIKIPISWPLPENQTFRKAMNTMNTIIYGLIEDRRDHVGEFGDLLDMLLEARDADTGEAMNAEQIRDELITVFGAGHETTAHSLAWTWMLLAQHPTILMKMQLELDSVLQGRTPSIEDIANLKYTAQIFNESMRLYPAAPIIPRRFENNLELCGYALEGPARVITSVYNIHRHPDFWPDPHRFDPDRFGPEQSAGRHRLAFMPFGAGSRMCIGNNLALMEAILLLAMVGQKYRMELLEPEKIVPQIAVTLQPVGGIAMKLIPRA
jgi:cytochrome P450